MRVHRRRGRNRVAGFTLVEALVATALMAMILTALATIAGQWMPNWNRGVNRVQGDEELALGLERLVADLGAAQFITAGRQTLKPFFNGTSESLTFVRTALSPNAHPELEIVRFAEVDGANGPVLVRTRARFVPVADDVHDPASPHFGDPVVLVRAPYRISFSYAGADRDWRDTWQQEILLPKAVRVTVRDAKTRRALVASTATLLHVQIPADCISAKSFDACLASRHPSSETVDSGKPGAQSAGQTQ
jgi:general secretion pathway protein J